MNMSKLRLISHHLCPYVQRAVISLTEKQVPFERIDIDLANKPEWFKAISPLGKTPVLQVGETAIFESAVILEYLEETLPHHLHPPEALNRAENRSWIEFGSAILNEIAGFYGAADDVMFTSKIRSMSAKFAMIERRLGSGPYFNGAEFSLVDAVFGPIFRYFDVFDRIADFGILSANTPKTRKWRHALAARNSIGTAVAGDYEQRLWAFLVAKKSYLTGLMATADEPMFAKRELSIGQ
jgi:glutathione S-transferase